VNRFQTRPRGLATRPTKRSSTGVTGVGYSEFERDGKRVAYFTANVGRQIRKFNATRLGRDAAFRRALQARAEYEFAVKGVTS
jgi:hypothetical protein